jgi:hypothetical protein
MASDERRKLETETEMKDKDVEFECNLCKSDKIALQWERDFPELEDIVDPTETIILDFGRKSHTFSDSLMAV